MTLGGKQRGAGLAGVEIWEISQKAWITGEHTKVIATMFVMCLKHGRYLEDRLQGLIQVVRITPFCKRFRTFGRGPHNPTFFSGLRKHGFFWALTSPGMILQKRPPSYQIITRPKNWGISSYDAENGISFGCWHFGCPAFVFAVQWCWLHQEPDIFGFRIMWQKHNYFISYICKQRKPTM